MNRILHIYDNTKENKNKFVPISIPIFKKVNNVEQVFCAIGDKNSNIDANQVVSSITDMLSLFKTIDKFDKIILHSCLSGLYGLILYIVLLSVDKNKIYMVLQGGEVNFIDRNKIKNKIIHFIRKLIMRRVGTFVTNIKEDYNKAINLYNTNANYIDGGGFYRSNIIYNASLKVKSKRILIGNSALPRNNHKIIIDKLADKKWLYNYECIIPLSYGDFNYAKEIEDYAKKKLLCDVIVLRDFMPLKSYLEYIEDVEIAFFYHEGQQGMGNIYNLLGSGTKVYLNDESYGILNNMGFKVYKYTNINNDIIEEHCNLNINNINYLFSEENIISQIKKVFNNNDYI